MDLSQDGWWSEYERLPGACAKNRTKYCRWAHFEQPPCRLRSLTVLGPARSDKPPMGDGWRRGALLKLPNAAGLLLPHWTWIREFSP